MNDRYKKKSEEYFDRVADENKIIREPQRCYPFVVESIKDCSGRLLDIGCGEGDLLKLLQDSTEQRFELNGIDISENALEKAKRRLKDDVVFLQGDSEHLPFDDSSFDVIVCTHSFHHYPNPDSAIGEMFRCLKSGGILCIVENYRREIPRRIRNLIYIILNHPNGDIRFYSAKEMAKMLGNAGFQVIGDELITKKSFMIKGRK